KTTASGIATIRTALSSCAAVNVLGYGTFCCSTDLCNDASVLRLQTTAAFGLVLGAILLKRVMFRE
ncbi:unnamed protein product, partial [Didymodactylos carnosus]